MISFLYTGADLESGIQRNPEKSLGGFISSSGIPSDSVSNIFGDISYNMLTRKGYQVRAFAVKNVSESDLVNFSFYFNYLNLNNLFDIEFSFVSVGENLLIEKIYTSSSSPVNIQDWYAPEGLDNIQLITAALAPGEHIGVWVKRTVREIIYVDSDLNEYSDLKNIPPKELDNFYSELKQKAGFDMIFSWD